MEKNVDNICTSLFLLDHPVLVETASYRNQYLLALQYFVDKFSDIGDTAQSFYLCYKNAFHGADRTYKKTSTTPVDNIKPVIDGIMETKFSGFRLFSYHYVFAADCLFLCAFRDEQKAQVVLESVKELFNPRYHKKLTVLFEALFHSAPLGRGMEPVEKIVEKWRSDVDFLSQTPERILVTGTMSAGKSTMINALIGQALARTTQEACTGRLYYYYNKPFDDLCINCEADREFYGVDPETLFRKDNKVDTIAAYFHTLTPSNKRVCIIDSPGVNSAINQSHKRITQRAVTGANYDRLVYVFHAAGGLGREEEAMYLKYIAEKVPKEKTIFVVNKLDDFRKSEDSIEGSISGVISDLEKMGYEKPCVCPLSAYFGFLIKKKMRGIELDEEEQEEFELYTRKFSNPAYDLSSYYEAPANPGDDLITKMSIRCGLYGLEKILMGG